MQRMLRLKFFGRPALLRDDVVLPLSTRKSLALLLLLARSREPLPRVRVVALLWPALQEQIGRRNLRRELARLREASAADAVTAEGDRLALAAEVDSDVGAFESRLDAGQPDAALSLWQGAPADGFALGDADAFDDWLAQQREQLNNWRRQALSVCAAAHEAGGDLARALACVEALLADDPLQEQQHRDAMRLLAASGRREAALAQYERCRSLLGSELGLTPMAQTETLAASLRGVLTTRAVPAAAGAPLASISPLDPLSPLSQLSPLAAWAPALPLVPLVHSLSPPASVSLRARLPDHLPFVGRSAEVMALERAWGAGRMIVIEGEAGVGKTRLATDFAAAHGPFAMARCRSGDSDLPYASFSRALRALIGPTPTPTLPDLPAWVGQELARLLPELGMAPPPIRSDEERSRFFEACARGWQALAAENFDAVLLDDWHLADPASRALLGFVAKRRSEAAGADSSGAREWLILRPELDEASSLVLQGLIEATGATRLHLQPLAGVAVFDLVRQLSGAGHPVRFAQRLEQATGGNPFFLAETLRHLAETDLLSSDASGGWHTPFDDATHDYRELPVPASVLDTVLARVQRLPAASRRVLEAAALAAEPFAPALLAPACALSELDAVQAIEDAVAASLLHEHPAGGFAFAHDLVQQALNGALSSERRRLVHRRLALGAELAGAPAATIAAHHEASGDAARAVAHRIAAGDHAQRLHALSEAMAQWAKALADQPTPTQALRIHERLVRVCHQHSVIDAVRAQADALAALLASGTLSSEERIEATVSRGLAMARAEQSEQALTVLDTLPQAMDELQLGRALAVRCIALHNLGRPDEARLASQAALALKTLPDLDRVELLDLAFISDHEAGRAESALAHADAALALSRRNGDEHGIARGHFRRGIMRLQLHDGVGAEAEMLAALEGAERLGQVTLGRVVLYNLCCVYSAQTLYPQSLAALQRGWAMTPPMQPGPLRVMYRLGEIDAHFALGDLGAVWQTLQLAVPEAMAQGDPTISISAAMCGLEPLGLLGEVALARHLLASITDDAARQMLLTAQELWVALAQFEIKQNDAAAAASVLAQIATTGDVFVTRVRLRLDLARAELALLVHDPQAALAALPADDAIGMNGEMRTRSLALRVAAQAALGGLDAFTVAAARAHFAAPSEHLIATLELHTALARASRAGTSGAPEEAQADQAAFVATMAATLQAHPTQEAAFRRAWG